MSDPILEIGGAGLETTDEKVKSLVNRMVNSETPGFKSSDVTIRSFPLELRAAEQRINSQVPKIDGTFYNHVQGSLIRTGKSTDLAIGSTGFFVVLCPWGEGYSRDGRFTIDKNGNLLTTIGNYPLVGQNGPIVVNPSSQILVLETGEIQADGKTIDRIRVVDFENKQALESVNGVVFKDTQQNLAVQEIDNPRMIQGYIEASNAEIIEQMIDLIVLSRLYDQNTKIVSYRDQALTRALEMGKM